MDIKGSYNYISKTRLVERIMELVVDRDIIWWTQSFLIDQKVQLIIDKYDNKI